MTPHGRFDGFVDGINDDPIVFVPRDEDLSSGHRLWECDGVMVAGAIERTVSARINRERLALLGWGRAILMQFAHPLIAAAVSDHSTFQASRLARLQRLHGTIRAMLSLTFGSDRDVRAAADGINKIHDRVQGVLREAAGPFPAGTRYSAHDPALLRWVLATLLDSVPHVYAQFVEPLSRAEQDQYCREAAIIGRLLGIPEDLLFRDTSDLQAYLAERMASGEIVVCDTARTLARDILYPPFHAAYWPLSRVTRLATMGLLDPTLRAQYGLAWRARDAQALERWTRVVRGVHGVAPDRVRYWSASTR